MANRNKNIVIGIPWILSVLMTLLVSVKAEVKTESACFGVGTEPCYLMSLECEAGSRILLLSQKYGVKPDDSCNGSNKRNRCVDPSRNGCCAFDQNDCMEAYASLHSYNLHRECSGKQNCGPLPAPRNILQSCNSQLSTYVYIIYECVADPVMQFCEANTKIDAEVDILFDKTASTLTRASDCSCFLEATNSDQLVIDYADVRMAKSATGSQGTDCSSAMIVSNPDVGYDTTCNPSESEERNFIFGQFSKTNVSYVQLKLLDLYKTTSTDAPEFIWLKISGELREDVKVTCFIIVDEMTTTAPPTRPTRPTSDTTSTTGESTNTTDVNQDRVDGGSGAGPIVAGVLVPLIILVIVALVVFFLYRRRGRQMLKRTRKPAVPNNYIEPPDEEYAEIGFVPDNPNPSPVYDPVYSPKNDNPDDSCNQIHPSCNGHTYQNVGKGAAKVETQKTKEKPSGALGKIRSHTERLISYFKRQTDSEFPPAKQRDREPSGGTYDHLRPTSGVHVEITPPPPDSPTNVYSHTTNISDEQESSENEQSTNLAVKPTDPDENSLNAVHIGDSYIEFQFGEVDESKLVKLKSSHDDSQVHTRPEPPSRPPPSPKITPIRNSREKTQLEPKKSEGRPKSPNALSPDHVVSNQPYYDYAEGAESPKPSATPRLSNASDMSSEHSYKVLEPQPTYDYADCSDNEGNENQEFDAVYEDVDENDQDQIHMTKHRSATAIPIDSNEYLEPTSNRNRAVSSPGPTTTGYVNVNSKSAPNKNIAENVGNALTQELQKTGKNKLKTPKGIKKQEGANNSPSKVTVQTSNLDQAKSGEDPKYVNKRAPDTKSELKPNHSSQTDVSPKSTQGNGVVKSDNLATKDYEKAPDIKGVLKMKQMFESKDGSESDSSRHNSPRGFKFGSPDSPFKKEVNSPRTRANTSDV